MISFYFFAIIIIRYHVHLMILHLHKSVFFQIMVARKFLAVLQWVMLLYFFWIQRYVWIDKYYYLTFLLLFNSWLVFIFTLFLIIWYIVASMILAFWQEVITLYDFDMIIIFCQVNWLTLNVLISVCCFLSFDFL